MNDILVSWADDVLHLTFNRAAKRNALSPGMVEQLIERLVEAAQRCARMVVFRGNGECFGAGFDFSDLHEQSDADLLYRFIRIETLLQSIYFAPFATVALAHGNNFGASVDILCSCTHRVGSTESNFRMPGLAFGLLLGTRRFAERVGNGIARRSLETGRVFSSDEAVAAGLLTAKADADVWKSCLDSYARDARRLSPAAQGFLYRATSINAADADMADLVRTASAPGMKARIQAYIDKLKASQSRSRSD